MPENIKPMNLLLFYINLVMFLILLVLAFLNNDENIGFDGYISTWILRIYIYIHTHTHTHTYIGVYFYMNIDISEINKNTLKFMEILSKSVKMTLIIKYIH